MAKKDEDDGLDKALRDLTFSNQGQDYTSNDYPRRSGRIRNCIIPPTTRGVRPRQEPVYDTQGKIQGVDLCDCLSLTCPGCFEDCEKCGSRKCSQDCRVSRKYTFSSIIVEGRNRTIYNPVLLKDKRPSPPTNQNLNT